MRVGIVVPSAMPPTWGGAERAWSGLRRAIEAHTPHRAEVVSLPVQEDTLPHLVDAYRDFARLDVSRFDLVLSSKYPAWMTSHPNHVLWMFHPLRGLYDTYRAFGRPTRFDPTAPELAPLHELLLRAGDRHLLDVAFGRWDDVLAALGPDHPELTFPGPLARALVHWLDGVALAPGPIARHCALSATVASRPGYFPPGVTPRVVYAPADVVDAAAEGAANHADRADDDPYLFTVSRLDRPKRIDLLVAAMASVPGAVELRIAGTGPAEADLRRLAAGDPRIRFLGFVPDGDLPALYAGALAVPFVPADEDFGLVALEAFACGTTVVTCSDSGGPAELVADGVTGLVAPPRPSDLGAALASLVADPDRAEAMGRTARRWARRIRWPATVAALLGERRGSGMRSGRSGDRSACQNERGSERGRARGRRPKVVVTATYRVFPPFHGGQLRCFHLYGCLPPRADVEIVSLVDPTDIGGRTELAPGLVETVVPRSAAHHERIVEATLRAGLPLTDILAGTLIAHSPDYLDALRTATRGAELVLLAHPYLVGATSHLDPGLPRAYDAHNAELRLKEAVLPADAFGSRLLRLVRDVEEEAVVGSGLVVACSDGDRESLAAEYGVAPGRIEVVPNGTDLTIPFVTGSDRTRRRDRWLRHFRDGVDGGPTQPSRSLAIFLASWHPPNLDAVEVILEAAAAAPEWLFVIGGSVGGYFERRPHPANVVLAGLISDRAKRALLACADVALNPMRTGSGTNLKVLEYLAAGVPVVSTAFGIRGLDRIGSDQVHVTDAGAPALVAALSAVRADPASAEEKARAGRVIVEEAYGWDHLGGRLADLVLGAMSRPGRGLGALARQ